MGAFQNYPYADVHQLNLDWIIKKIKEVRDKEDELDQAVLDAKNYAESANESAVNAENYFNLIQNAIKTPEMFGAVGDGVADDTQALQSCLTDNSFIYLKNEYRITSPLIFDNLKNVIMFGGKISRPTDATFNTVYGDNCENIYIHNVMFEGNGNNRNMTYTWKDNIQGCIILASKSKNIFIEKCKIKNFNYGVFILGADDENEPVSFENTSANGVIRNCLFYNINSPIDTYGKDLEISNNMIYDTTGNAIQIEPVNTPDMNDDPLQDIYYDTSGLSCSVHDNLIINVVGVGINIHPNSSAISIKNNAIINFGNGINADTRYSRGIIISDNFLYNQNAVAIDNNTRPWGVKYGAAIKCGSTATVSNNIIKAAIVGLNITGGALVCNNVIDHPRISGIVTYYATSATGSIGIYTGNKIIFTRDANGWWGCRAFNFGSNPDMSTIILMNDNVVESDVQPLKVEASLGIEVKITNLITSVAVTDTIATITTKNIYSN